MRPHLSAGLQIILVKKHLLVNLGVVVVLTTAVLVDYYVPDSQKLFPAEFWFHILIYIIIIPLIILIFLASRKRSEKKEANHVNQNSSQKQQQTDSDMQQFLGYQAGLVARTERQRIARDLHDTLAQDIGYLRFMIDKFCSDNTIPMEDEMKHNFECMREVANGAYIQIRSFLDTLEMPDGNDLVAALTEITDKTCERTNLKIKMSTFGPVVTLSPEVQHQIVLVFREALTNIGKHANGHLVDINLMWGMDDFTIEIIDDGCGFNTGALQGSDQRGLANMNERAKAIGGKVTITSSPENGTRLRLWLPTSNANCLGQSERFYDLETGYDEDTSG